MNNRFAPFIAALLFAGAVSTFPVSIMAQTTNKPPVEKKTGGDTASKKQIAGPFHGKLAAVDKTARTITVGKRTFHILPETKILKHGKPATLDDGVVSQEVSGYFKTTDNGNLVASKVTFGPKPERKTTEQKSQK